MISWTCRWLPVVGHPQWPLAYHGLRFELVCAVSRKCIAISSTYHCRPKLKVHDLPEAIVHTFPEDSERNTRVAIGIENEDWRHSF
jgi:hypothetical protein